MTDPTDDETQTDFQPPRPPDAEAARDPAASPPPAMPPGPSSRPLRADPDRPVSEWREPPWFPPNRDRSRDRGPSAAAIVVGLVILAIGLYYFVDRTLGISLPAVRWASLWPLILIVIGGVIVARALSRR